MHSVHAFLVDVRRITLSKAHLPVCHHLCTAHVSSQHAVPGVSKSQQTNSADGVKVCNGVTLGIHFQSAARQLMRLSVVPRAITINTQMRVC